MKKRKKLEIKELSQLKGGKIDVKNVNMVEGCVCEYLNLLRVVENHNLLEGCRCTCVE